MEEDTVLWFHIPEKGSWYGGWVLQFVSGTKVKTKQNHKMTLDGDGCGSLVTGSNQALPARASQHLESYLLFEDLRWVPGKQIRTYPDRL